MLRHQHRITKYDPTCRNSAGHYTKPEWISYSDIGRAYEGVTLTEEAYLKTESAYLATVLSFHAEAGFPEIRALGVECHAAVPCPAEGAVVTHVELEAVCRSLLREAYWCRLEGADFFIHFGYDYYMYIGTGPKCRGSLMLARRLGLFPEPFVSPYHADPEL
ncbi:MAG: hypothetical protein EOP86_27010 [Verrucomicrobiaceae bacterium]|nr:MAG: hypothetical protein EOP86_27010 [Verrucomicrobiaceae bacterium]